MAAITPAVIGAMLFARTSDMRDMRLSIALLTGVLCGLAVMLVSRSVRWDAVLIAATLAVAGVVLGFLFDARWNADEAIANQIAAQLVVRNPELELNVARMQAQVIVSGMSTWEIVQGRLNWIGKLTPFMAILGAWFTVKSRLIGRLLRLRGESNQEV